MEIEKYRKSQRTKTDVFNFTFCLIFYLFQKHDSKEPSLYCNICITFFDIWDAGMKPMLRIFYILDKYFKHREFFELCATQRHMENFNSNWKASLFIKVNSLLNLKISKLHRSFH